jgi:hypothetical protein
LRRRGSDYRRDHRNNDCRRHTKRAHHFAAAHGLQRRGSSRDVCEQMISTELIERQPDDLFVDRLLQALCKRQCDLFRRSATVTAPPDQRRSLIEAMSSITIEIINESFVRKCLHDEPLFSRARFSLVIGLHVVQFK